MDNEILNSLDKISKTLKELEVSSQCLSDLVDGLEQLNESCAKLVSTTSELNSKDVLDYIDAFSNTMTVIESVSNLKKTIDNLNNVMNLASSATELATVATTGFQTALKFFSGPIGIAIGALGLLTGALTLFNEYESEADKSARLFAEAQIKTREEINKTTESLIKNTEKTKENVEAINSDYSHTLSQVDQLVKMTGEDGYIKNIGEAKYLIDEINDVLPNSVELTENNKIVWKDLNGEVTNHIDKIKESIEALKQKAIVEAYQKEYLEAIKEENEVLIEKIKAENALNDAAARYQELQLKGSQLTFAEAQEKLDLSDKMNSYKETISSCNEQLTAIQETTNNYTAAQKSLSGETEDMANFLVEQYTRIDTSGQTTFGSLGEGLMTLDAKIQAHNDKTKEMSDKEIEASRLARDKVIEDLCAKAYQLEYSYESMISTLESEGVYLNEAEKELLKESVDVYQEKEMEKQLIRQESYKLMKSINSSELDKLNEDTKQKLATSIELFSKTGSNEGLHLCNSLIKSLQENDGRINKETMDIIKNIEILFDNADPKIKSTLEGPTESNISNVLRILPKQTSMELRFVPKTNGFRLSTGDIIGIKPYFEGGFPETGQLFLAREAGPELVGRINGKTAVANNDQIVSGISSGVFNAVRSAMQGSGNGNMNIHATFVMDGEVVGKQVIKYHNGVVKRTGITPLMI